MTTPTVGFLPATASRARGPRRRSALAAPSAWPPAECARWIACQHGATATAEECLSDVASGLGRLTRRKLARLQGGETDDEFACFDRYLVRVWECVEYHWRHWAADGTVRFDAVVDRLEAGEIGFGTREADVILEVVLAQALELGDARAAEMFETDYMPRIRSVARHLGGERALDAVENFAAELVLPRGGRPPRIASFQGRTPLASGLRAVVTNFWISQARKRQNVNLAVLPECPTQDGDMAALLDAAPCEEVLRPIFALALKPLATEDRLLLKMLVLDGVGQNELARSLNVNSGTLTRRRQRATGAVLANVRELVARQAAARQAADCLELVLAGSDPLLRARLAELLAAGVRGDTWGDLPRSPSVDGDDRGGSPCKASDDLGRSPHEPYDDVPRENRVPQDREVDDRV